MFLLYFSLYLGIITYFDNIFVGVIPFIFILLLQITFFLLKKISFRKSFGLSVLALGLVVGSVFIKNHFFSSTVEYVGLKNYMGMFEIKEIISLGKYVVQSKNNNFYIFHSQKKFMPGEKVFSVGSVRNQYSAPYLFDNWMTKLEVYDMTQVFKYEKRLYMKGYHGVLYEKNSLLYDSKPLGVISSLRESIRQLVIDAYKFSPTAGLVLGMLIGDKSLIPSQEYESFIGSGIVHIIAVSGGNIAMIVIFLSAVLFFVPFYLRIIMILLIVLLYCMICGNDSSVVRAMIMGSLSLFAILFGRSISIRRSLQIGYVAMLLYNPYFLLFDVGFLLSFSAIIGIVVFQPQKNSQQSSLPRRKRFLLSIYHNYLHTTLSATIGVMPIILFFMGYTNIFAIIANLMVLPIIPLVMIYGFVSIIIYAIFPYTILLRLEKILIGYIYGVADFFSQYGIYLSLSTSLSKYVVILLFLGALLWYVRGGKVRSST